MPVQNSNSKMSACSNVYTNLLQILIQTTFNSLLYQKRLFTLCPRRCFVGKMSSYYSKKVKIENRKFCLSKKEVFRKLTVQKTGRTGPGKVPALDALVPLRIICE